MLSLNGPKGQLAGWGVLLVGAGVAFYAAKQTILERRRAQPDWKARSNQQQEAGPSRLPAAGGEGIAHSVQSGSERSS